MSDDEYHPVSLKDRIAALNRAQGGDAPPVPGAKSKPVPKPKPAVKPKPAQPSSWKPAPAPATASSSTSSSTSTSQPWAARGPAPRPPVPRRTSVPDDERDGATPASPPRRAWPPVPATHEDNDHDDRHPTPPRRPVQVPSQLAGLQLRRASATDDGNVEDESRPPRRAAWPPVATHEDEPEAEAAEQPVTRRRPPVPGARYGSQLARTPSATHEEDAPPIPAGRPQVPGRLGSQLRRPSAAHDEDNVENEAAPPPVPVGRPPVPGILAPPLPRTSSAREEEQEEQEEEQEEAPTPAVRNVRPPVPGRFAAPQLRHPTTTHEDEDDVEEQAAPPVPAGRPPLTGRPAASQLRRPSATQEYEDHAEGEQEEAPPPPVRNVRPPVPGRLAGSQFTPPPPPAQYEDEDEGYEDSQEPPPGPSPPPAPPRSVRPPVPGRYVGSGLTRTPSATESDAAPVSRTLPPPLPHSADDDHSAPPPLPARAPPLPRRRESDAHEATSPPSRPSLPPRTPSNTGRNLPPPPSDDAPPPLPANRLVKTADKLPPTPRPLLPTPAPPALPRRLSKDPIGVRRLPPPASGAAQQHHSTAAEPEPEHETAPEQQSWQQRAQGWQTSAVDRANAAANKAAANAAGDALSSKISAFTHGGKPQAEHDPRIRDASRKAASFVVTNARKVPPSDQAGGQQGQGQMGAAARKMGSFMASRGSASQEQAGEQGQKSDASRMMGSFMSSAARRMPNSPQKEQTSPVSPSQDQAHGQVGDAARRMGSFMSSAARRLPNSPQKEHTSPSPPTAAQPEATGHNDMGRRVSDFMSSASRRLPPTVPFMPKHDTHARDAEPEPYPHANGNGFASSPPPVLANRPPPVPMSSRPRPSGAAPSAVPAIPPLDDYLDEPECLECRDYSAADARAAQFPRTSVPSLEWLAAQLCSPFTSRTDRARVIFTWLHHNIDYDVVSFFNNNVKGSTAQSTLSSGLAVCEGYAKLFEALGTLAGLDVVTVSGHGKGFGYAAPPAGAPVGPPNPTGHAWNAVVLDGGEWKLVDACWGAGIVKGAGQPYERRFAPEHFTRNNVDFGRRHFPQNPGYEFLPDGDAPSWEEYVRGDVPGGGPPVEVMGITPGEGWDAFSFSPRAGEIDPHAEAAANNGWVRFEFHRICEHWDPVENGPGEPYACVLVPEGASKKKYYPFEYNGWASWVDVEPEDLGPPGSKVDICAITTVGGQDARGVVWDETLLYKGVAWQVLARWKVV